MKRAVQKCPRWNFKLLWRPRNQQNKSGNNIAGHPVGPSQQNRDDHKKIINYSKLIRSKIKKLKNQNSFIS